MALARPPDPLALCKGPPVALAMMELGTLAPRRAFINLPPGWSVNTEEETDFLAVIQKCGQQRVRARPHAG